MGRSKKAAYMADYRKRRKEFIAACAGEMSCNTDAVGRQELGPQQHELQHLDNYAYHEDDSHPNIPADIDNTAWEDELTILDSSDEEESVPEMERETNWQAALLTEETQRSIGDLSMPVCEGQRAKRRQIEPDSNNESLISELRKKLANEVKSARAEMMMPVLPTSLGGPVVSDTGTPSLGIVADKDNTAPISSDNESLDGDLTYTDISDDSDDEVLEASVPKNIRRKKTAKQMTRQKAGKTNPQMVTEAQGPANALAQVRKSIDEREQACITTTNVSKEVQDHQSSVPPKRKRSTKKQQSHMSKARRPEEPIYAGHQPSLVPSTPPSTLGRPMSCQTIRRDTGSVNQPAQIRPSTTTMYECGSSNQLQATSKETMMESERQKPLMDMATFQWQVYSTLLEIKDGIKGLNTRLDRLERKEKGTSISDAMRLLPEPMTTKDQVDELEALLVNPKNRAAIVEMLAQVGGPTVSRLTINIMNRIMDCAAAKHFNLRGTDKKITFKQYRLYSIVFEAVKLAFPAVTPSLDIDIQGAIGDNLRAAGSKLNRRNKKAQDAATPPMAQFSVEHHSEISATNNVDSQYDEGNDHNETQYTYM